MEKDFELERYKDFKEWYQHRGFGGSTMSALFDKNPYQSKLDVYASIVNAKEDVDEEDGNESTQYGKLLEPLLIKICEINFKDKFDVIAFPKYAFYRKKSNPICTASLDGEMTEKESGDKWILEIKTHDIRNRADEENWNGHLPDNYFIQCLSYLNVCNTYKGAMLMAKLRFYDYFAEDGKEIIKEEIRYYKIERKDFEKDIEYLNQVATNFYQNNILKHIPPEIEINL